jgi:hypothetical protein
LIRIRRLIFELRYFIAKRADSEGEKNVDKNTPAAGI